MRPLGTTLKLWCIPLSLLLTFLALHESIYADVENRKLGDFGSPDAPMKATQASSQAGSRAPSLPHAQHEDSSLNVTAAAFRQGGAEESSIRQVGIEESDIKSRIAPISSQSDVNTLHPAIEGHGSATLTNETGGASLLPHHVIIVPYRDRSRNLKRFVRYLGPYLATNFPNDTFSLYIVEQGDQELFNRGFLFNVGFTEAISLHPNTQCVTIHDVDLIPKVDGVPYTNCTNPIQLGSELEHFKWGLPYDKSCGGIVNMNAKHWAQINGMSNDYEGWGGEDDDLYRRLLHNMLLLGKREDPRVPVIARPPKGFGRYKNTENKKKLNYQNKQKGNHAHSDQNNLILKSMENGSRRWKTDGLNDLRFKVKHEDKMTEFDGSQSFRDAHFINVVHDVQDAEPIGLTGIDGSVSTRRRVLTVTPTVLVKPNDKPTAQRSAPHLKSPALRNMPAKVATSNAQQLQTLQAKQKSAADTKEAKGIPDPELVVWFGQGPAKDAEIWKKRLDAYQNARLFYHSYDEPCDVCIYKPRTSFAEGRNLALRQALKTLDPDQVKYFVTFDSDLELKCLTNGYGRSDFQTQDGCWGAFHDMLSRPETQHPIISPKTWWDPVGEGTNYQTCAENSVNAFRGVDMVKMMYPMSHLHISKDWTYNTHVGWHLLDKCLPNIIMSDARFVLSNPTHSDYPKQHKPAHVFDILNKEFADLGPWYKSLLWHRCSVSETPREAALGGDSWAQCETFLEKRFKKWLGVF